MAKKYNDYDDPTAEEAFGPYKEEGYLEIDPETAKTIYRKLRKDYLQKKALTEMMKEKIDEGEVKDMDFALEKYKNALIILEESRFISEDFKKEYKDVLGDI